MQAIITQRTQHSLPNFSGWYICPQWLSCSFGNSVSEQQEYLLSASSARWFVNCLSILGWFGYLPICSQYSLCFANPQGFNSFSPGKYHCITFSTHRRTLSKYDAWGTKNFKKIECSPTGSPREIRYPAAILKRSFPLPPCCGIHLDRSR